MIPERVSKGNKLPGMTEATLPTTKTGNPKKIGIKLLMGTSSFLMLVTTIMTPVARITIMIKVGIAIIQVVS